MAGVKEFKLGQALYRKYRSKSLDEVVGQEHITTTLKNALKTGKISHAYLLTGPRGVGKTSVARILAFEVNGLPYAESKAHLDIIEIDAASNRRIDEIRDLRDKVYILPTTAKYKVYIIDEVHMLTREAFNALLKTLEEPPEHVIFILATTEVHKLPETIISRTQHFSFKPITKASIVDHLRMIANKEKIAVEQDALELIAEHGDGSFRDSISLLDQARHTTNKLDTAHVERLLGIAPSNAMDKLEKALQKSDYLALVTELGDLRSEGFRPAEIAKQMSNRIRSKIINGQQLTHKDLGLLRDLLSVSASSQPEQLLELILLDAAMFDQPTNNPKQVNSMSELPIINSKKLDQEVSNEQTLPAKPVQAKKLIEPRSISKPVVVKESTEIKPPTQKPQKLDQEEVNNFTIEQWPIVLSVVKQKFNTLYGILRMANAELEGNKLILTFKFAFHQKQIKDPKNKKLITDIIREQNGDEIELVCNVSSDKKSTPSIPEIPNDINTVSDIFGGAEVLES